MKNPGTFFANLSSPISSRSKLYDDLARSNERRLVLKKSHFCALFWLLLGLLHWRRVSYSLLFLLDLGQWVDAISEATVFEF